MKFEEKKIVLEHGFIEIEVVEKGAEYFKYPTIEFCVEYDRKNLNYFRYETFDSLNEAYEWYKRLDLNMRGA